jgi:hypothetical protein
MVLVVLFLSITNTYRLYDQKGYYAGKVEGRSYGVYRLYDQKGNFKGTIEPRSSSNRVYDTNGKYKGKIDMSRPIKK